MFIDECSVVWFVISWPDDLYRAGCVPTQKMSYFSIACEIALATTAPKECSENPHSHHIGEQGRFLPRSPEFAAGVLQVAQVSIAYGQ